eukprot:TRINITY_DN10152_c0_g1_i2.p1 TRINITY_DN10152_c0_g1~~TRINITY_DN10152_c0_g1_i2.p1  ORF type:complete len:405 (-),score=50.15 TRINITY_DN10152_c0_g1_i2:9-1223(-)
MASEDIKNEKNDHDDDEEEETVAETVQLGFIEKPDPSRPLIRKYFPSKAGGKPVWLNPRDIPPIEELTCSKCQSPLRFLLQVYAPLDGYNFAFHRTLYVFCCEKVGCLEDPNNLKVFRSQLPRRNEFYPYNPPEPLPPNSDLSAIQDEEFPGVTLCYVCGLSGKKKCGQCRQFFYCSRHCQKLHWTKYKHSKQCRPAAAFSAASADGEEKEGLDISDCLFPENEIVIEEEELEEDEDFDKENALYENYQKEIAEDPDKEDENTETDDKEEDLMGTLAAPDKVFDQFQKRINYNPEQIIRYNRSETAQPLWAHSQHILDTSTVPPCPVCGDARIFEFQVLPQFLYYAKVEERSESPVDSLDFGTIAIFTCRSSCQNSPKQSMNKYVSEYVYRQPPIQVSTDKKEN